MRLRYRPGKNGIVLVGMVEMAVQSVPPGKRCSRRKDLITEQVKCTRERSPLVLELAEAFERVSLPVVWRARRTSIFQRRFFGCDAATSNTSGAFSLKGSSRSRSRPSRPSSLDRHGAACSFALCFKVL